MVPTSCSGMIASAHPVASQAGAAALAAGGNAFDAAVAVAATLNVVEPYMSGLAGMGYATMWVAAEAQARVLDFVTAVPRSFPAGRFHHREQMARGPLSVGVPGNLAGWCALWRAYGSLPLGKLLAPAAQVAEDGFAVGRFGSEEINMHGPRLACLAGTGAAFRSNYPFCDGIRIGATIRQPELAATLRLVAEEGPGVLYGGPLGQRIVSHLRSLGGTLELGDLVEAEAVWREPLAAPYRGLLVHVPPPPCEGFQFLLTLRLLEGFDVTALGSGTAAHLDLVIRATRLAAGARIANNFPDADEVARLLSDRHVGALRRRLRDGDGMEGPTEQWTPSAPAGEDPGHTTSFSVADRDGNLVCVTQSLGSVFGSGVVVPGTGVLLNNFLYWADVQAGSPNRTAPGRPLPSCMAPSISTRSGVPVLALGTPGSYGILQTQAQAMVHHLDFGLPLQEAVEAPRARIWDGRLVEVENRINAEVISALRHLGHDARAFTTGWTMKVGGMQAIQRDGTDGRLTGAADPRRDGSAMAVQVIAVDTVLRVKRWI